MSLELLKLEMGECLIRAKSKETVDTLSYLMEFAENHLNNGWVSVKDELPKSNGDFYLVFTDKGKTTECRYYCNKWITTYCNNEKVTHWQPLPQPPKEQTND